MVVHGQTTTAMMGMVALLEWILFQRKASPPGGDGLHKMPMMSGSLALMGTLALLQGMGMVGSPMVDLPMDMMGVGMAMMGVPMVEVWMDMLEVGVAMPMVEMGMDMVEIGMAMVGVPMVEMGMAMVEMGVDMVEMEMGLDMGMALPPQQVAGAFRIRTDACMNFQKGMRHYLIQGLHPMLLLCGMSLEAHDFFK